MSLESTLYRSLLRLARSKPFAVLSKTCLPPYTLHNCTATSRGLKLSNSGSTASLPLSDSSRLKACIKAAFRLRSSAIGSEAESHIDDAFAALRALNSLEPGLRYSLKHSNTMKERLDGSKWQVGDVVRVGNERCTVWHVLTAEEYWSLDGVEADKFAALGDDKDWDGDVDEDGDDTIDIDVTLEFDKLGRGTIMEGKQDVNDAPSVDTEAKHYYLLSPTSSGLPPTRLEPKVSGCSCRATSREVTFWVH